MNAIRTIPGRLVVRPMATRNGSRGALLQRVERAGDVIEALLPLAALAVSALLAWAAA